MPLFFITSALCGAAALLPVQPAAASRFAVTSRARVPLAAETTVGDFFKSFSEPLAHFQLHCASPSRQCYLPASPWRIVVLQ